MQQRIALVTGAASGSGKAIATRFADDGMFVFLVDRDLAAVEKVVSELVSKGKQAVAAQCDVSDGDSVRALATNVAKAQLRIDVLVNNAGIGIFGSIAEFSESDWDLQMDVNAKSVFLVTKYFLPFLGKGEGASIINLGSGAGVVGVGNSIGYCASKGAIVAMSRSMAIDLAPQGIRVNCLCPGVVDTPFNDKILVESGDPEGVRKAQAAAHLLNRLATAEDIANMAAFLASDQASFVTGATVMVDGGLTAQ